MTKDLVLPRLIYDYMDIHPSRAIFLADMITSISKTGKANLKRLVEEVRGKASPASNFRRGQRFFKEQEIDMVRGGILILKLLSVVGKYKLVYDRTEWKFGKTVINYFVVSIIIGSTAIPICWIMLDKKGNSSTEERMILSERLFEIIPKEMIECAFFDREFIGQEWFEWLNQENTPFVVRLKENFLVKINDQEISLSLLCAQLKTDEEGYYQLSLWGTELNVAAKRLKDGSLLILASNHFPAETLCASYRDRWTIETGFKNLKTNGFDLEATHMTDPEKLSKLMFILAVAFVIAVKTGIIIAKKNP